MPPSAGSAGKASGTHQNTTDRAQGWNASDGSDFRTQAIELGTVVASKRVTPEHYTDFVTDEEFNSIKKAAREQQQRPVTESHTEG